MTELNQAYGLLNSQQNDGIFQQEPVRHQEESMQIDEEPVQVQAPKQSKNYYDTAVNAGNDQEKRLLSILNEIKKKGTVKNSQPSYFDKLASKSKDLVKLIQFALIVVLALSIHAIIKHYLKEYLSANDFSTEREVGMRLLYPLAVVFILWNIKALIR